MWEAICHVTKQVVRESGIAVTSIEGIGFDATCSLAVIDQDDCAVSVAGPDFTVPERNIILWCDVSRPFTKRPLIISIALHEKQTLSTQPNTPYSLSKGGG
jgi:hypothetical protein